MATALREPIAGADSSSRPEVAGGSSPELQALLRLLRFALGTAEDSLAPGIFAQVDPARFAACVERHRVGAFLHGRLPSPAREQVPDAILAQFGRAAERGTRRSLLRSAELVRIVRRFSDSGIPVASVKGPLLAQSLYGELGQRHSGDLDLLVAPQDVERADALLRASGYQRTEPDFELTPRQFSEFRRFKRDAEYVEPNSGIRVELSWRLFHIAERCSVEFEGRSLGGQRIATLKPDDNVLYLFAHGARHGWFRLFWLVDVALLLRDDGTNWTSIAQSARRFDIERSVAQGARLAGDLLGTPVPAAIAKLSRDNPAQAPLLEYAHRQVRKDVTPGSLQPEPVLYAMRLQSRWRAKWIIFRGRFMYPANWRILPLADRWFALHYPAAPLLWLYRRTAGRRRPGPGP